MTSLRTLGVRGERKSVYRSRHPKFSRGSWRMRVQLVPGPLFLLLPGLGTKLLYHGHSLLLGGSFKLTPVYSDTGIK